MAKRLELGGNGRGAKTSYHHGDLERAMVDLAVELISTEGFESLTLRKLGGRLGVSSTAIYRHFSDKGALITRLAEEGFLEFGAMLRQARDRVSKGGVSKEGSIVRMTGAYIHFAHGRPAYYRLMFGEHFNEVGSSEALRSAGESSFRVMADEVVKEIEAGRFRTNLDPMQVAISIWSLVHGFASLSINGQFSDRKFNVERAAVAAMAALLEGYRA
jgi:AcrR family transcriptional regulator